MQKVNDVRIVNGRCHRLKSAIVVRQDRLYEKEEKIRQIFIIHLTFLKRNKPKETEDDVKILVLYLTVNIFLHVKFQ